MSVCICFYGEGAALELANDSLRNCVITQRLLVLKSWIVFHESRLLFLRACFRPNDFLSIRYRGKCLLMDSSYWKHLFQFVPNLTRWEWAARPGYVDNKHAGSLKSSWKNCPLGRFWCEITGISIFSHCWGLLYKSPVSVICLLFYQRIFQHKARPQNGEFSPCVHV